MMSTGDIAWAARRLFDAERSRKQIGLLSLQYPEADMDDAYAVQAKLVRLKLEAGRERRGWKIGLTSRAMQQALNIDIPDSGILLDDMFFEEGGTVPSDRFIQPRVEAEVAFVLKSPLAGVDVTIDDVLDATDYVCPSLEILDTRIVRTDPETKQTRTIFDTIADNAANAGVVLSARTLMPRETDLRWMGAIVSRNRSVEETGLGAGVLNHPAAGIVWLARRLQQYGMSMAPGDVVLSGSFVRPVETQHGDTISADFGPHGTVAIHFA